MSLINQVLNDLERRGTSAARTEAVRAVPSADIGLSRPALGAAAVLLVVLVVAWWWEMHRQKSPPPQRQHIAKLVQASPKPVSAPASVPAVGGATGEPENTAPSLNLSFELSSIPLPSSVVPPQQAPAQHANTPGKSRVVADSKKPLVTPARTETQEGYGGPPIKHISPQQQAVDEYGQALALIQQGRNSEAVPHLETTLQLDPDQTAARQTLAGLLLDSRRNAEAERLLQQGLHHDPRQSDLAMLLARLQVERGAMQEALQTLTTTMPFADQRADYHAFLAAVLQRLSRNKEAIIHYQIALHLHPASAVWWMGLGISFQAVGDDEDARDAYKRAADMHKLSPQLQTFVEQRLKALQPAK